MSRLSKQRLLHFVEEDEDAFADALRARWPTLTFMNFNYQDYQIPDKPDVKRISDWRKPPRYKSPTETDERFLLVSVEPEDWQPVWSEKPNENGIYTIQNQPRLHFAYRRGWIRNTYVSSAEEIAGESPMHLVAMLKEGDIWAHYDSDDDEHRKFLGAVWRIFAKLATNKFDIYSEHGEVRPAVKGAVVWVGHHALEWAAGDPRRWISEDIRPHDSPGLDCPYVKYMQELRLIRDAARD